MAGLYFICAGGPKAFAKTFCSNRTEAKRVKSVVEDIIFRATSVRYSKALGGPILSQDSERIMRSVSHMGRLQSKDVMTKNSSEPRNHSVIYEYVH